MPSASTGNIPGKFRSLQGQFTESFGSRKYLAVQMSTDEVNHLRATIDQLKNELHEERTRVDALKACLEQEREKYNKLSTSMDQNQPQSIQLANGGNLEGKSEQDQTRLDQEVIVYYVRKLETEQLQKMQMQNQVDRMQEQVSRLLSDKEFLRAQLKLQDSPNANFEKFYIDELEKKLEAHRQHETKLASDLQVAQTFVKDLQEENKSFLSREKEMVNQLERLQDQKIALAEPNEPDKDNPVKLSHANSINEALQGKIRLLENRIGRLQDDLETSNLNANGGGMAIMMSSPKTSNKKPKDPNKPTMKLRIWRLERQKKCLVWQKKYLQAVLQNVENEGNGIEQCRNNSSCNCNNTSSSESHSLVSVNNGEAEGGSNKVADPAADPADPVDPAAHQTDPEGRPGDPADPASAGVLSPHHSKPGTAATSDKKRPSFRVVAQVVVAVIRLQGCAESWRKMVSKSQTSTPKSTTPLSD